MDQGRLDEALACFKQQIAINPEDSTAQHLIASLTGNNTEHAPHQYVEKMFNGYADNFDSHLQQTLKYDIPKKLAALVAQHLTPSAKTSSVLDLGCGTGLVGLAIAPFARQLVGVDLSAKMLEKARARNIYQRLEHSDLLTMMHHEKPLSYDVIIAADVFVYIGRLEEIFREIKRLLCTDGICAFSIENHAISTLGKTDYQGYLIENTGRYSHSTDYISRLAAENSLSIHESVGTQIRVQFGVPVSGHIVLLKNRVPNN